MTTDGNRGRLRAAPWLAIAGAAVLTGLGAAALPAQTSVPAAPTTAPVRTFRVSYLSSGAVYLDGGRQEGLAAGSRLEIRRNGEAIAEVEVAYLADHSASCRVVAQRLSLQQGDEALLLTPAVPEEGAANEPPAAAEPEPGTLHPPRLTATPPRAQPAKPFARASGSFALGYQQYSDRVFGSGYDEGTGRLSLRLRDLGRVPLDLRVRLRARQTTRDSADGTSVTAPRSDRLYELSLTYAPEAGRFSWAIGRLGASPFVSIGYLDGALAQVRLTRRFYVGGFGGSRPEVEELGLASAGTKYGAYLRYSTRAADGPGYAEVVLAGIGEYATGGEVSREYVSLESRFGSGARWSIFQRAELDLNRGWRQEVSGTSSQVTNASLSASVRMSDHWRALLTYDQRRNYLTYETRPRPEDVFVNFLRQGARASLEWQGRSGWNASGSVGQEREAQGGAATDSAALSIYQTNLLGWGMLLGADVSYYSGGLAEGYVTTLRLRKYLRHGHDLGLTFGASEARLSALDLEPRRNQWVRLSGTVMLPFRVYLLGEYEYDTGSDLEGQRYYLELGYRF